MEIEYVYLGRVCSISERARKPALGDARPTGILDYKRAYRQMTEEFGLVAVRIDGLLVYAYDGFDEGPGAYRYSERMLVGA